MCQFNIVKKFPFSALVSTQFKSFGTNIESVYLPKFNLVASHTVTIENPELGLSTPGFSTTKKWGIRHQCFLHHLSYFPVFFAEKSKFFLVKNASGVEKPGVEYPSFKCFLHQIFLHHFPKILIMIFSSVFRIFLFFIHSNTQPLAPRPLVRSLYYRTLTLTR